MKLSLILIFILIIYNCSAQDYITGEQYKNASEGSVDVVTSHLVLFQAQAHFNKVLNNISLTDRVAPARMLMNDGTILKGSIQRILFNCNVGYGSINKFGVFAGTQSDFTFAGAGKQSKFESRNSQFLLYFGLSALGFQLDIGFLLKSKGVGDLDNNNEFAMDTSQIRKHMNKDKLTTYSIYHKTGMFFSATYGEKFVNGNNRSYLSEYRFNVQPLKKYLPDIYGLPFMDLVSYTPLSSYYSKYKDFYDTTFQTDSATANKRNYEWSPGSDGVYKKGTRASVTFQVYPKVIFRKAEIAYNYFRNELSQVYGSRLQFFMKNKRPNISFDAFVTFSTESKKATVSLSYSYNSPDNITFIPLPKLHVFGIQVIFGRRETVKALIPYAAAILSDEDDDDIDD